MSAIAAKIAPQLCGAVHEPPTGPGWLHDIKHDGHRFIATIESTAEMLANICSV
jgi:bifunctional non-homologous end joining protein LigD